MVGPDLLSLAEISPLRKWHDPTPVTTVLITCMLTRSAQARLYIQAISLFVFACTCSIFEV